jgi:eukaryotic-like serine/threonine-protein kinase
VQQELWWRVEALFHAVRERPPEDRAAFLDEACGTDAELRHAVTRLLSKEAEAASFLEGPSSGLPVTPPAANARPVLEPNRRIGPYQIESVIGAGGMGEVYKALDTRLDRSVAIKVLPPRLADDLGDPGSKTPWRARFDREAKAIASLSHPHVCALFDVGDEDGLTYLVMEYIEGQTLAARLQGGPLPVNEALRNATEIAEALAAAHRQGVIHRDLKPANVMVTADGQVKVLDFGLAKQVDVHPDVEDSAAPTTALTSADRGETSLSGEGAVLGTPAYMSPEQVEGRALDARSDIFSFGAVLYELLTGRRAFPGQSPASIMSAILHDAPAPVRHVRRDVPASLDAIVSRCLEKDRDRRYASGAELREALAECGARLDAGSMRSTVLRDRRLASAALVAVAAVSLSAIAWSLWRGSRVSWARTSALPEVTRLIDGGRSAAAFRLLRSAERYLPNDPEIATLRRNYTRRLSVRSEPPGAQVRIRDYLDTAADAQWDELGRTPLEKVTIPAGHLAYRISKPGYATVEGYTASAVTNAVGLLSVKLDREGTAPPGMVRVPARPPTGEFWLDKYEVTNASYKEFVDRGGYQKADSWKGRFTDGSREVGWERMVAGLIDATGRPGPATWRFGAFPQGQADYPVGGVSWYEAAAYCEARGKALPTIHHWRTAAQQGMFATILQASNFSDTGPARVGSHAGLGPFGTYDAAGNVREWCLNASGANRTIMGGAWSDPQYFFQLADARLPTDRSEGNGFRCAKYIVAPTPELTAPTDASLVAPGPAFRRPVSEEVFQAYKALQTYDHGELDAKLEAEDDSSPFWRQEKVSFAAYGNERVTAYIFLPRNAEPPFQTVVTVPGIWGLDLRDSARLETQWFDFFTRSGRAVVHPIFKGMYERTIGLDYATAVSLPTVWRELALAWHKDLGRTLDYLETRPDIARDKLAYHGISLGTAQAPRFLALEPRLKVAVLFWGGFAHRVSPDINPVNYAAHSTVPTLMVSGNADPLFPEATSQIPFFQALGTPDADKHRLVVEGAGHVAFNRRVVQEALAWLDKYLGPVRTR